MSSGKNKNNGKYCLCTKIEMKKVTSKKQLNPDQKEMMDTVTNVFKESVIEIIKVSVHDLCFPNFLII